jgi:hypothetical protein
MEAAILGQKAQLLRTELSIGLLSLREEFGEDISGLLQRVQRGTGTATPCDALSKLGHISMIVKHAIQLYESTNTGQLHFALGNLGAFSPLECLHVIPRILIQQSFQLRECQ